LRVVDEVARRMPEQRFIICGQGDPTPWLLCPNVEYKPPIHGRERAVLLGNATAVMCPSEYIEPFCGVNVEAQLCGTPVVSTDFGAFVETIEQGITGWRCHMLQDYVEALKLAPTLDRRYISDRARARYSLEVVGKRYDSIFKQIYDQKDKGWYSETSYL
jgi:glycosyltransferase involved in cell wall biosynthesis